MNDALGDEEGKILEYLSRAAEERSDHISIEELQQAFRIPLRARAESFLASLKRKGYIRANPGIPFGFEILRNADGSLPQRSTTYGTGSRSGSEKSHVAVMRSTSEPRALTPRQREAYDAVRKAVEETGLPPSTDELRQELGLGSLKRAHELLEALERKQLIRFIRTPTEPGEPQKRRKSRGIELINRASDDRRDVSTVFLTVMGQVAAGEPVVDESGEAHWGEFARDTIELSRELLGGHDPAGMCVLDVGGDSMIDAGVLDGDRVIVSPQQAPANGDLVVARFFNETAGTFELTVKRYERRSGHPWLVPANKAYEPIDAEYSEIVGRVIALLRYPL